MKKYLLFRFIRSIFSIIAVMAIVFTLIYSLIPMESIFNRDSNIAKYSGDRKVNYMYQNYERYGYVSEYVTLTEWCGTLPGNDTAAEILACANPGTEASPNPTLQQFTDVHTELGYVVEVYPISKQLYAYKIVPPVQMMFGWFGDLIFIDHVNFIQDENNPDLERTIYFGTDWTGVPALMGSGTYHKYLIYFDTRFPFIHQNIVSFNFGRSFPTYANVPIIDVITQRQGNDVFSTITFPTGNVRESTVMDHTCVYKANLSSLDRNDFVDNYANCLSNKSLPSMLGISFIMGIFALLITYLVGIPIAILMARHKDKIPDKIGIGYVIFIIAVPAVVYIYTFSIIGNALFGLPLKFPPAENWTYYVLPIISLSLPGIAGIMMWLRRYLIDQSTSDYVKFARAKGLAENEIFVRHVLKNASIPFIHSIPGAIVGTLVGAIITETVYAVPGMGKMLTQSINEYNNGMVIALTFIFTALSVFSVLAGDILITWVDPRISLAGAGGRK